MTKAQNEKLPRAFEAQGSFAASTISLSLFNKSADLMNEEEQRNFLELLPLIFVCSTKISQDDDLFLPLYSVQYLQSTSFALYLNLRMYIYPPKIWHKNNRASGGCPVRVGILNYLLWSRWRFRSHASSSLKMVSSILMGE